MVVALDCVLDATFGLVMQVYCIWQQRREGRCSLKNLLVVLGFRFRKFPGIVR